MQNIAFGKLHIPKYDENQKNLNAIIPDEQTRKIAKQTFDKINDKTGDKDVFLHVVKSDEVDLKSNNQLNWYTVKVANKSGKTIASEILLRDSSDNGANGSYVANFKRHMDKLEDQVPQMSKSTTDSLFDIFA